MIKSNNVPGQAEGYYLQETRFLYHLLDAKSGDLVCLECLGDVATKHSDGTVTTEEDKSAISENPVTDRSVNLWKTFYNWIRAVEEGRLDPHKTCFRIYVPHDKFSGSFIEKLHKANTEEVVQSTLHDIKEQLWGKPPEFDLKNSVSDSICEYVNYFFTHEKTTIQIVINFEYEKGGFAGYDDINTKLLSKFIPPEHIEIFRHQMLGWIKERIDKLIANGEIAMISHDEYIKEGQAFLRKLDRQGILNSVASKPSPEQAIEQIDKSPMYVRQLEYIDQDFNEIITAVCDFMMAEIDRYHWIENGLMHKNSADEFEANLSRTWNNVRGEVRATESSLLPEQQGAAVYFKCKQHNSEIERNKLPVHFVPGTFHLLADKLTIGWHPDWEKLCSQNPEAINIENSEK